MTPFARGGCWCSCWSLLLVGFPFLCSWIIFVGLSIVSAHRTNKDVCSQLNGGVICSLICSIPLLLFFISFSFVAKQYSPYNVINHASSNSCCFLVSGCMHIQSSVVCTDQVNNIYVDQIFLFITLKSIYYREKLSIYVFLKYMQGDISGIKIIFFTLF